MNLKLLLFTAIIPLGAFAQDYIESFTHNTDFRGAQRSLQYTPTSDGYIANEQGNNLYTRALYGGHSLWRLETSDRPIFAAYHKSENRNIHFTVTAGGVTQRLDSVAVCRSLYSGGQRIYHLSDPAWGKGRICLSVLAPHDGESAIWRVEAFDMHKDAVIDAFCCATIKIKINRSGDMGADPANCFAPDEGRRDLKQCSARIGGRKSIVYIMYSDRDVTSADQKKLARVYDRALDDRTQLVSRIVVNTPDAYINTLAPNLLAAADGIWDGLTYQHGAIGWRMPLAGWRGAYTGDFLGWHDRARTHFDAYAQSQVTDVPPTIEHPSQDEKMNLARADKKWGTQMYSNGYLCRNPQKNNTMHHYDMVLCYIDELLWHLQWTGDTAYARAIWPTLQRALAWEKRNYDPNDDGLYDAYCCIWASDALYYNSGGVTHSSAYNYRANKLAAVIASIIGEDPRPYIEEADKILTALNSRLWMADKGVWAEFCDLMGEGQMHTHPGLWTVYHAIDSETATPRQAYLATRYIDGNIPHIPVVADGLDSYAYYTISTTDWLPYSWSINNVAFAEVYHTALAYWEAGRADEATRILKSSIIDGQFLGNSPGNIGQISFYDAARGESYRDFADPVGVMSRALVQGLFGFTPNLLSRNIIVRPGMPSDWEYASMTHPDFAFDYKMHTDAQNRRVDAYTLDINDNMVDKADTITMVLPLRSTAPRVYVDGVAIHQVVVTDISEPYAALTLGIAIGDNGKHSCEVVWDGTPVDNQDTPVQRYADIPTPLGVERIAGEVEPVEINTVFNSNITDIFNNRYLSPRSPYTTLQLPSHGMGEWCHPTDTAKIDDSMLRRANGSIRIAEDLVFITPPDGHNIAYTSLYDNYPDSISIPITGCGRALALLMAGSTNHMQCYNVNATLTVVYTDGTSSRLSLVPPYNWAPIEQDYYVDGKAFAIPTPRQLRVALKSGESSRDLGRTLSIDGVYGRRIDGGAANVIYLPTDPDKQLARLELKANANEVVIGIAGVSIIK